MDSEIVVALIGAGVTVGNVILTNALNNRKKNDKIRSYIADGIQSLLRTEIIRAHEKYTTQEFCPIYAKEALTRQYNAYHNLGGNDVATELYKQIMYLPDKPREEKKDEED